MASSMPDFATMRSELIELKALNQLLTKEKATLMAEREEFAIVFDKLEKRKEMSEAEINRLRAANAQLTDQNTKMKAQLQQAAKAVEYWKQENAKLKNGDPQKAEQARKLEEQNESLTRQKEALENENQNLRHVSDVNLRKSTLALAQFDMSKKLIEEFQKKLAVVEAENKTLKAKIEATLSNTQRVLDNERKVRESIALPNDPKLTQALLHFQEEADALNLIIADLRQQLRQQEESSQQRLEVLESLFASTQTDLITTRNTVEELERNLGKSREESLMLREQLVLSAQRLREAGLLVKKLREEVSERYEKSERSEFGDASEVVEAENKILKSEIEKAMRTIDELRAEVVANTSLAMSASKEGWLVKKNTHDSFGPKHQKKWFVLKGQNLLYYKSPDDNMSKPSGSLILDGATITILDKLQDSKDKGLPFSFEIRQDQRSNFHSLTLSAGSNEERLIWIDALNKAKDVTIRSERKPNSPRSNQ